ncbi:MAG: hypothetical protein R3F24_04375 [Gammaproteobacteria bacterium]
MQHSPWLPLLVLGILVTAIPLATMADVLDGARAARDAARTAEAPRYAADRWARAEKDLAAAERKLEQGNVAAAAKRSANIEGAFRDTQLEALRNQYLATVRLQLMSAEKVRAERYAPRTLASARQKLEAAEADLARHRAAPEQAATAIEAARLEACMPPVSPSWPCRLIAVTAAARTCY